MDSYNNLLVTWFVLCVAAGFYLLFKTAPYGKYLREGWGVQVPSRLGWILFESPPVFLMIVFFISLQRSKLGSNNISLHLVKSLH